MDGKPVFIAEGKFDGSDKSWQAGVADYYLFSSFEKDALDVYEFTGSFAKKDSTGGEVLTFRIRDLKQLPQGLPLNSSRFPKTRQTLP